jgi:hypothetical protein
MRDDNREPVSPAGNCQISKSGAPRPRALKLDSTFFRVRCLFDRDHLPLHWREFGGSLLIATDKERRRPEKARHCSGSAACLMLMQLG